MIYLKVLCIIQAINDAFYQILSTSKFAQVVEGSKNIVFVQKAKKYSSTVRPPKLWTNSLDAVLELAQGSQYFQIAVCQGLGYSLFGEYWI